MLCHYFLLNIFGNGFVAFFSFGFKSFNFFLFKSRVSNLIQANVLIYFPYILFDYGLLSI